MTEDEDPSPAGPPDPELIDLLGAALPPDTDDEAQRHRVRRRVLQRMAAESTGRHLTLADPAAGWQPFGPGLNLKLLHEAGGVMAYLVRLAPGASLPPHRHPVDEECLVLEGRVRIGTLELGPGGFHLGRRDVLHDRLDSPDGALIYLRGAVPDIELIL